MVPAMWRERVQCRILKNGRWVYPTSAFDNLDMILGKYGAEAIAHLPHALKEIARARCTNLTNLRFE